MDAPSANPVSDDVEEPYLAWRRWRWPILGFVVAAQIAAILLSPVTSSPHDLAGDLAAGRVRSVDVGSFQHDLRATARASGVPTPKITPGTSLLELLVALPAFASAGRRSGPPRDRLELSQAQHRVGVSQGPRATVQREFENF